MYLHLIGMIDIKLKWYNFKRDYQKLTCLLRD